MFRRVRDAAADTSVRVIVVTGAGRAFSTRQDLAAIGSGYMDVPLPDESTLPAPQGGDDIGQTFKQLYAKGWQDFITCRKPTIAAINGGAFEWGFILSLHCDIRFAANTALVNATFARLGVPAEKNAAWLLARLIGPAKTADLLYTARRLDAKDAKTLAMVNVVIDDGELQSFVNNHAQQIAQNSAPRAFAGIKAQICPQSIRHTEMHSLLLTRHSMQRCKLRTLKKHPQAISKSVVRNFRELRVKTYKLS